LLVIVGQTSHITHAFKKGERKAQRFDIRWLTTDERRLAASPDADKILRMNDRERFFQSVLAKTIERIEAMSETQVVDGLRAVQATGDSWGKMLPFIASTSFVPAEDPDDEINKLRTDLGSRAPFGVGALRLSGYIEDALKKRLETLRRKGK
jgi:hypothetical protein